MSWSIYVTGTKEKVKARVDADKAALTGQEKIEYDLAKQIIKDRIDCITYPENGNIPTPWTPNAIKLEAAGHGCAINASLKIDIQAVRLEI